MNRGTVILRWVRELAAVVARLRISLARRLLGDLPLAQLKDHDNPAAQLAHKLRNPGLDCPRCSALIPLDIARLLTLSPIVCPNPACRQVIEVDVAKSRDSIDALQRFQTAMTAVERAKRSMIP